MTQWVSMRPGRGSASVVLMPTAEQLQTSIEVAPRRIATNWSVPPTPDDG